MGAVFLVQPGCSSTPRPTFRLDDHAYGSIFFLMTGFHGLHVIGGLVFMGGGGRGHRRARHGPRRTRPVEVCALLLALRRRRVGGHVRHHLPAAVRRRATSRRHRLLVAAAACWSPRLVTPRRWLAGRAAARAEARRRRWSPRAASCTRPAARAATGPTAGASTRRRGRRAGPSLEQRRRGRRLLLPVHRAHAAGQQRGAAQRKQPAYDDEEIEALVAYVGIARRRPADARRRPRRRRPGARAASVPGQLPGLPLRRRAAAGALSYGRAAPRLHVGDAEPGRRGGAGRPGPDAGVRPRRDRPTRSSNDLARLRRVPPGPRGPGRPADRPHRARSPRASWPGSSGMVALLALVAWIGTRSPIRRNRGSEP